MLFTVWEILRWVPINWCSRSFWPELPRDWPYLKKEPLRNGYISVLFLICWLIILPGLNLQRAKFHPLSKKNSSGFFFVSQGFLKKEHAFICLTHLLVFFWTSGRVRLSLVFSLCFHASLLFFFQFTILVLPSLQNKILLIKPPNYYYYKACFP